MIGEAKKAARSHWTEVLLPLVLVATVGVTLYSGVAWGYPVALLLSVVEGAAIFHFAPKYRAALAAAGTWEGRAKEVRAELMRFRERALHEDHETGVGNSRQLDIDFVKAVARFRRQGEPFALVLIELRHSLGRQALGTDVVAAVAGVLLQTARAEDSVCRVDERAFAVLLSASDASGARAFIQRARVRANTDLFQQGGSVTFLELVGGAAVWRDDFEGLPALLAETRADLGRYEMDYARQAQEFQGGAG
jgi:GGDEF domain-containing protein